MQVNNLEINPKPSRYMCAISRSIWAISWHCLRNVSAFHVSAGQIAVEEGGPLEVRVFEVAVAAQALL